MRRRWMRSTNSSIGREDVLFTASRIFDGERFQERPLDVLVLGGRMVLGGSLSVAEDVPRVEGGWLLPGIVDAHVHLSLSRADEVVAGGVTSVLDLGAPLAFAFSEHPPLCFAASGPFITAVRGYPTTSWGANGYGLEVGSPAEGRDAVALLADRGAAIVKVAIEPGGGPMLDAEALRGVVDAAHARGLKVVAHALGREAVRDAVAAGVDVLAHTPTERLPDDLVGALGGNGVTIISTMRAFGARTSTRENLAALAAAGCPVAYGTDLGNEGIRPGIDVDELAILEQALGDRTSALAAATSLAGRLAGSGGRIVSDAPADLLWVPRFDSFDDLLRDARIWIGRR